ncbi:MAG: hypothetical protein ACRDRA_13645 [Pseudonocardiaceae bacterium]
MVCTVIRNQIPDAGLRLNTVRLLAVMALVDGVIEDAKLELAGRYASAGCARRCRRRGPPGGLRAARPAPAAAGELRGVADRPASGPDAGT